jgi:hypothetical protein
MSQVIWHRSVPNNRSSQLAAVWANAVNRPRLQQLLSNFREGLVDTVVVYKVDRLRACSLAKRESLFHNARIPVFWSAARAPAAPAFQINVTDWSFEAEVIRASRLPLGYFSAQSGGRHRCDRYVHCGLGFVSPALCDDHPGPRSQEDPSHGRHRASHRALALPPGNRSIPMGHCSALSAARS